MSFIRRLVTHLLLLLLLLANMAVRLECRVSIPHTVTTNRHGLNSDNLLVLLKHIPQGKDQLDRLWNDLTAPTSPEYRNFKTASEVLGMIAPAASDVDEVVRWLAMRGYTTLQRYVHERTTR